MRRFFIAVLLVLLVVLPCTSSGDVAFDTVSTGVGNNTTTTTVTHTASGSNRAAVVFVVGRDNNDNGFFVSTVTYDSVSMTEQLEIESDASGSERVVLAVYDLPNPSTTTDADVVVTLDQTAYFVVGVLTFTGAHQTSVLSDLQSEIDFSTASLTFTCTSTGLGVDAVGNRTGAAALTADSPQDERFQLVASGNRVRAAGSTEAGATSITMGWTGSFHALHSAHIAGCVDPAEGAAAASPKLTLLGIGP